MVYCSSNKTLTLLLPTSERILKLELKPPKALLEGGRHGDDWEWDCDGSGSSNRRQQQRDFNNAFGEEESRFAVGDRADTGRRPLRPRLQLARRRFRVAVMAQREWRVLTAFWRRRLSRIGRKGFLIFFKFNPRTYRRTNPSVIRR